jgi:FAD/FMN-containing dehydrogenase
MAEVLKLDRRAVLLGASALAASSAMPRELRAFAPAKTVKPAASGPSDAAWRHLGDTLSGPLLRADSFNLRKIVRCYNLRYGNDLPDAIALCRDAADVATAIKWSRENKVPIVIQSGGHSYAGFSMRRGALMINTMLMREAAFEGDNATIGAGVRNGQLYSLMESRRVATTHGRCPTVGAAGFLLGGGIGFNARSRGLACDQLLASEIVTADGDIRTLKAEAGKKDLFWACQGGGGGNFGVNTSFTLKTFPVEHVTMFDLTWVALSPGVATRVAIDLITALERAPIELGLGTRMSIQAPPHDARSRGINIALIGQLGKRPAALEELLGPAYRTARPQQALVQELPYWEAQALLEDDDGPTYFQERSTFAKAGQAAALVEQAVGVLRAWPGTSGSADLRLFQMGGRVNEPKPDDTAFVHRSSEWIVDIGLSWNASDPPESVRINRLWQDRFYEMVRSKTAGGAYQNFIDPSLVNWQQDYYGTNLAELRRIKRDVDKTSVFNFPMAIPPAETVARQ